MGYWEDVRRVDHYGLGRHMWLVVTSTSLGMFLWGFMLALAPLTTQWSFVPRSMDEYILLASPVSLLVGNLTMGRLSDLLGRRHAFLVTLAIYGVGVLLIMLSNNAYELMAGIALGEFGLGGEEPATLAYIAEMSRLSSRERLLVGITNVANIGAAVAAGLAILVGSSMILQKEVFGITIFAAIAAMLLVRLMMPESYRWMSISHGIRGRFTYIPQLKTRLIFLTLISITIVLTYALLALVMGPYLFPSLTPWIVLLYNVGESVGGFIAMFVIEVMGTRPFTLLSYLGGLASMLAVVPQLTLYPHNLTLFLTILLINGIFGEFGWAVRVVLEPELFPTSFRSSGVALVRAVAYALYIVSLFLTASFTVWQYAWYNIGLWALGLAGSAIWYMYGVETVSRTLEEINGETGQGVVRGINA